MDQSRFWQLIDGSIAESNGDPDTQLDVLGESLRQLPVDEIIGFQQQLDTCLNLAYTWDLWGASSLLNSGGSEEAFEAFRGWLVAHGSEIFNGALSNPDTLAEVTDPEVDGYEFEEFLHLPHEIFEEMTNEEASLETAVPAPAAPAGEKWDFEDPAEASQRLPQIFQQIEEHRKLSVTSA
tara:strand:- start:9639 stop:10178 length:540 start_codon:yes stop_codon:yes gene_type:complete